MKISSAALSIAAAALLFVSAVPARAGAAGEKLSPEKQAAFLGRLEKNIKASRTFHASFSQEKHLSIFDDVLVSSGALDYAAPSSMRWEILSPFRSLLVMNGRAIAKYDYFRGKPRKLELAGAEALYEVFGQIADLHQGKFSGQAENYGMAVYDGETPRLVLVPRSKKMKEFIPAIEMTFPGTLDSVSSVRISEKGGDFTLIKFTEIKLNPEFPPDHFAPGTAK